MIHRFLLSCLALLVWASPAAADFYRGNETYQFTLKYFEAEPDYGLANTTGDITLTFTASYNFYEAIGPSGTGSDQILEYSGASLQVVAPPGASCTYVGPDVLPSQAVPFPPETSHPCPYDGTSRPFEANFTGKYQDYFLLQLTPSGLSSCFCSDGFGFEQQLYFPPTSSVDGYFKTGTFDIDAFEIGTLTITAIDPPSTGGGGGSTGGGATDSASIPVPEPAGWALMVGGIGLIGTTRRRRPDAAA